MSGVLRAFAIIVGVLDVGFAFFPLFVFVFGAQVDPLRAFLFWLGTAVVTVAVLVVGINLAVRRSRRGRDSRPFDAATLGATVVIFVLIATLGGPLTQR